MGGRLLERFKKSIVSRIGYHMYLIYNINIMTQWFVSIRI